jgi:hypothetical protein
MSEFKSPRQKKDIFEQEKEPSVCTTDISDMKKPEREVLDESKVNEAIEDVAKDESWTEETEDKIAPIEKAGSPEIDKSTRSTRFAIEHEEFVTKDTLLKDSIVKKLDKPADTNKDVH